MKLKNATSAAATKPYAFVDSPSAALCIRLDAVSTTPTDADVANFFATTSVVFAVSAPEAPMLNGGGLSCPRDLLCVSCLAHQRLNGPRRNPHMWSRGPSTDHGEVVPCVVSSL